MPGVSWYNINIKRVGNGSHPHNQGETMTKIPALNGVLIGDRVRSFDFQDHKELEGARACYMEGQVTGIEMMEGCWRYKIEVRKCVSRGEVREDYPSVIYPPLNGTPRLLGGECNGVEKI
jgi:hypothetical protein